MVDIQTLKARVDLRTLVQETHPVVKGSKTHCLWHDDRHPSLHIYPDGYFCFACGASGDHLDWLTATRPLSFQEAVDVLTSHAGTVSCFTPLRRTGILPPKRDTSLEKPNFEWRIPLRQHQFETHRRRAAKLTEVPEALKGRGFTLADCKRLDIVNENGNAIFPISGPSWVLTLKCRYAVPNPHRYEYVTPGRGTPAWCSPYIYSATSVLVIEGELNGMICWLALQGQEKYIGVMGTAGTNGLLYLDVLEDKIVYIYADGDVAGHEARLRWAKQSLSAGAKEVYLLEPGPVDACDIAGAFGKTGLRKRLVWVDKQRFVPSEAFGVTRSSGAAYATSNDSPPLSAKPNLMQWCSPLKASPSLSSVMPPLALPTYSLESRHDAA